MTEITENYLLDNGFVKNEDGSLCFDMFTHNLSIRQVLDYWYPAIIEVDQTVNLKRILYIHELKNILRTLL